MKRQEMSITEFKTMCWFFLIEVGPAVATCAIFALCVIAIFIGLADLACTEPVLK